MLKLTFGIRDIFNSPLLLDVFDQPADEDFGTCGDRVDGAEFEGSFGCHDLFYDFLAWLWVVVCGCVVSVCRHIHMFIYWWLTRGEVGCRSVIAERGVWICCFVAHRYGTDTEYSTIMN